MKSQDFEEYARIKPFTASIADTWSAALDEALADLEQPVESVRFLDYGCGDGKYFRHLSQRGFALQNIHGLEVSNVRLTRCHNLGWLNAQLLMPGDPLPYADAQFDLVTCMEVIEHIPSGEGARVIAELRRVLRPGGVLLISTPNYPIKRFYDVCDAFLHGKWRRLLDDPTHVTRFTHGRLTALLRLHFRGIEARPFKSGFLYKRIRRPFFLHKLFFRCRA